MTLVMTAKLSPFTDSDETAEKFEGMYYEDIDSNANPEKSDDMDIVAVGD